MSSLRIRLLQRSKTSLIQCSTHRRSLSNSLVTYDTRENGKIGILTLNNPDKMNALTEDMGDALKNVIDNISHHCTTHENHVDSSLRTVIITGAGRAFSAGGDLDWLNRRHHDLPENNERIMLQFYKRFLILRELPVPIIAAINGPAIGAGLSMAVGGCDIRIASTKATMGFTFNRLGLHPGMAALHFAPLLVGPANASDLLITGRVIKSSEALQMGLVNKVSENALEESINFAQEICKAAPIAVKTTVQALRRRQEAVGLGLEESMKIDAQAQAITYKSKDFAEGLMALKEKRPGNFKGV